MNSSNHIETEIIVLKAIQELIDSIVNFEILNLGDEDPTNISFHSDSHAKLFNILLVDLLSCMDKEGPVENKPYLCALREITNNPHFDVNGSVELLRDSTLQFRKWLKYFIEIPVYIPWLEVTTNLNMTRRDLVINGGNICRHNVLKAARIAETNRKLLEKSGHPIKPFQALFVLTDINDWLHGNVFPYHSSSIAEFLNNIRWGIYEYLIPEYDKSKVMGEEILGCPSWKFTYPDKVESDYAKKCYRELMEATTNEPFIRKFKTTKYLKMRH